MDGIRKLLACQTTWL